MALEYTDQVLRTRTCLHANASDWQIRNELNELPTIEFVLCNGLARAIATNEMEPGLSNIDAEVLISMEFSRLGGWLT